MAAEWYCQVRGKEYGPFEAKQLKQLAAAGKLQPTDLVRRGAEGRWAAASKVQGLTFAEGAASPASATQSSAVPSSAAETAAAASTAANASASAPATTASSYAPPVETYSQPVAPQPAAVEPEIVNCPTCGGGVMSSPDLAGQTVGCPHCGAAMTMPGAPAAAAYAEPSGGSYSDFGQAGSGYGDAGGFGAVTAPATPGFGSSFPAVGSPFGGAAGAGSSAGGAVTAPLDATNAYASPAMSCPSCGSALAPGETRCTRCASLQHGAGPGMAAGSSLNVYIDAPAQVPGLQAELGKQLKRYLESEQFAVAVLPLEQAAQARPEDLVIRTGAKRFDYGSQLMRAFIPIITRWGPGACILELQGDIQGGGGGIQPITKAKSMMGYGFFGGTGNGLMKLNVKNVSKRIGNLAARQVNGNKTPAQFIYNCARGGMITSLISLVPFPCVGLIISALGLGYSLYSFIKIRSRKLPKRQGMALTGLIAGVIGLVIQGGLIFLLTQNN